MLRTGNEPIDRPQSPADARLWLSMWGLIWAVFGTAALRPRGAPRLGGCLRGAVRW